jgi:oligosaccharyltransferase complex subunit gamma
LDACKPATPPLLEQLAKRPKELLFEMAANISWSTAYRGFQADAIANHLRGLAKLPSLQYSRPVDKAQVAKNVFSTVVGALTIWRLFPYIKVALVQRYIWAFLAIVGCLPLLQTPSLTLHELTTTRSFSQSTILLMNSGYMWCQIRKPQYAQVGHGGAVSYIAGGYQNQLGAEVYIVSAICE